MNVDDLGFYFSSGDKCFINSEISDYLKGQPWEKFRVKHVFSVYLLGIYCYDNIETIRCSLNSFIKNEIWKDPNTSPSEEEKVLLRKNDNEYKDYKSYLESLRKQSKKGFVYKLFSFC